MSDILTLNFPDYEYIHALNSEMPDLDTIFFHISDFLSDDLFSTSANKLTLKITLEPSLNSKISQLKITYYLMRYYIHRHSIKEDISTGYWPDYYTEYFYRIYFTIIDLIFQCFAVFYDILANDDDCKLTEPVLKAIKSDNNKLYDYLKTIYESDSYKNGLSIRNRFTHNASPSERWVIKRKVDRKNNRINYLFGAPQKPIDPISNSKELLEILFQLYHFIHKNNGK